MLELVQLDRALCLPIVDVAGLLEGQLIVALPKVSIQQGWLFALYPCLYSDSELTVEQQYRSPFLGLAQTALAQYQSENRIIKAWAKCEQCKMLSEVRQVEALSELSIWSKALLKRSLEQHQHLFLAFLRVYKLPEAIQIPIDSVGSDKLGKFIGLSTHSIKVTQVLPVLQEAIFDRRKQQLEDLRSPLYPGLEKLQSEIANISSTNLAAQELNQEVRALLGWANYSTVDTVDSDLAWIQNIANVGNSSDGDLFEKLVRKSFIKLGFSNSNKKLQASLDPNGCGGAGGLDFYCEQPYQVVGECKATKTEFVSDGTPAQLIKLGLKHLGDEYNQCIKIIMAAGELNSHAKQTAIGNTMNVLRPETLQKLVELKARHKGAINLLELKPCLETAPFGEEADTKVNNYIEQVEQSIKIRSHVVEAVKQLTETEPERKQFEVAEIRVQYNALFSKFNGGTLDNQTTHEILIELSSPLTGYLGRVSGTSLVTDRFYFLRDLIVD